MEGVLAEEKSGGGSTRLIGRPKGTGSQRIYEVLRQRILTLEMPPGSGIDEIALVGEFGVSRTPVREALIRLSSEGFVTLLPNRGASVSPLDIDEIPELLEAMELCLRVTSRWAAIRRTDADLAAMRDQQAFLAAASEKDDYVAMSEANSAFHLAIAKSARNRHMSKLYRGLLPQYHRLSLSLLSSAKSWTDQYKRYFSDVLEEHESLIAAIEARDSARADRIAQNHARLIGKRLEAYIWNALSNPIELSDPHTLRAKAARGRSRRQA
jgi:DNA-binding GntR family transcriptional regulator